jgi:RNA polymerase sigma factor (sigma-70 family)
MAVAVDRIERLQRAARVRTAGGDEITHCYRDFDAPLRAFLARQTRCVSDAEDLAQETFLRLLRMDSREEIRSVKAFLFKTATNLMRDRVRRTHTRMMRSAVPASEIELPDTGTEPSKTVESMQTATLFAQTIATLRSSTREAFLLYRLDACSHAQIARRMGISVSMVEKHVSAAMAALHDVGIDVR